MKTIHVAAAVIVENHKIFAARRGYGEFKGYWEFPGGKIGNAGNSPPARNQRRTGGGYCSGSVPWDRGLRLSRLPPHYGMLPVPRSRGYPDHPGTFRLPVGEERGTGKYGLAWCGQDSGGVGDAAAIKPEQFVFYGNESWIYKESIRWKTEPCPEHP